jgi:site-specific DNA recombinase
MMSEVIFKADGRTGRVAAIYARVSSERQRQDETIQSQTVGLRELAAERGLLLPEDLVFEDEGFSGASLTRPALERLRDRAAEGAFEVLLCHAPDRLARRYAYQVLLLEELHRAGVEVCFAKEPERGASPEDELLRQFQGMIAEYERAQIRERTRRGKLHRARTGSQAVLSCAPYGYRYVKKSEHSEGFWEIDEAEAQIVREVFARYVNDGISIGELARWLTERGIPTRTGKAVWDRSSVWAMLRNTAYRGQAAFGKTKTLERHGKPTRTTRERGERHGHRPARADQPAEKWTLIAVPAIVSEETFELAQARLSQNAHFAKRNTKRPTLLQGILVCRECGYGCYRTTTRTTNKRIYYYRCIGSDNYRHVGGRVCHSRPIRADELDALVWSEVRRLLEDPSLVRAEIDRRLQAARTEHPAARRRESLERDITRAEAAITRLIEAYQEQLLSLEELRGRMPGLRKRQTTLRAQLDALDTELHDAETYLKLADTLESFLTHLSDELDQLSVEEQQRILRLVVREVLIGGDEDTITIRHSIPTPNGRGSGDEPTSYQLRGSRLGAPLVYTPDISTAGSPLGWSRITLPDVPSRPSPSVSSDSCARSSNGSTPSTTRVHSESSRTIGSSPRGRRASWSSSTAANASGPPPSQTTPAGTPPGSTPTDTDVARWPSPTSNHESLPGRPPSGPSSSPAINIWFGAILRRHSQCMIHRPESDLSVRPISTCLASLVTLGSARPACAAAARAISTASGSPAIPAAASRFSNAANSSPILALGGSSHSASGIRSILRRFSRSDTIRVTSPRAANRSTVSRAARDRAASLSAVAVRR